MDLTICKSLPEDAIPFTDCVINCWQSAYKGIVPDESLGNMLAAREQLIEKYSRVFTNPGDCVYYYVMYNEKMVGFLIINKNRDGNMPGIGEIWAIYLMDEFCGKGYGKKLLDFEVNELKRLGCRQIYLWVLEENGRARRFYEKHGFRFTGTVREVSRYGAQLIQVEYVLEEATYGK